MKSFLVGLLILPALAVNAQHADQLFIDATIQKIKNAKAYTLGVAQLMPADKYEFKAAEEEMSFGEQLLHICNNMAWLSSSFLSDKKSSLTATDKKLQSKEEIIKTLNNTYDFVITVLENFDTKTLGDSVKFFAGPMNKLQIINLLNDHQTHHRGQLLVYLRLNGLKPPNYVGW